MPDIEQLLWIASPLGPYAEKFDLEARSHLGNFPQVRGDGA
jgi:hypothetical protein